MEIKLKLLLHLLLLASASAQGASLLERSYAYVSGFASAHAPGLLALASCASREQAWSCAREQAGRMLDVWDEAVEQQRRSWGEAADREAAQVGAAGGAGRAAAAAAEPPSAVAGELEASLQSLTDLVQNSLARAMARKKGGGGIDSITLSTSSGEKKKKMKKKKKKPQKIQIFQGHPQMLMMMKKQEKGRQLEETRKIPIQAWVIGSPESEHEKAPAKTPQKSESHARVAREVVDAWTPISSHVNEPLSEPRIAREGDDMHKTLDLSSARGALQDSWDNVKRISEMLTADDEEEFSSENDELREGEQRGKKKKKKKAILKLLLLGAVAKAKIGLLLQILSAHLQIKFFLIALAGLIINVARFWLDLKKGGQPQKVIYYEHAQHQHHYEHEDEGWGGGGSYWSRSLDEPKEEDNIYPIETENEGETHTHAHIPYRAYRPAPGAGSRAAGRAAR